MRAVMVAAAQWKEVVEVGRAAIGRGPVVDVVTLAMADDSESIKDHDTAKAKIIQSGISSISGKPDINFAQDIILHHYTADDIVRPAQQQGKDFSFNQAARIPNLSDDERSST